MSNDARRRTPARKVDALLRETVPGFVNIPEKIGLDDLVIVYCARCGRAQTVQQVRLNKINDGKYSICCDDNLVERAPPHPLDPKERRSLWTTNVCGPNSGVTSAVQCERCDGTTTEQMKAAPRRAVYVWCTESLHYPRHLARYIGRGDLQVVSPRWLTERRWQGMELTGIVLDHATELSMQELEILDAARIRIRRAG